MNFDARISGDDIAPVIMEGNTTNQSDPDNSEKQQQQYQRLLQRNQYQKSPSESNTQNFLLQGNQTSKQFTSSKLHESPSNRKKPQNITFRDVSSSEQELGIFAQGVVFFQGTKTQYKEQYQARSKDQDILTQGKEEANTTKQADANTTVQRGSPDQESRNEDIQPLMDSDVMTYTDPGSPMKIDQPRSTIMEENQGKEDESKLT